MNKLDQQYTDLLKTILEHGVDKKDRTGTGTKSIFGYTIRHNMKDGFPLLTTKKMPFKTIVTELLWFLRGDTNIKFLVDNNCHIWDGDAYKNYCKDSEGFSTSEQVEYGECTHSASGMSFRPFSIEGFINKIKTDDEFAKKWGELGPIYGNQWRKWGERYSDWKKFEGGVVPDGVELKSFVHKGLMTREKINGIDQIQNLINDLKTNPDSRRLMVNAWNVGELDQMVLPPCHYGFQVYTRELSLEERIKEYERRGYTKNIDPLDYVPSRAISLMWNQRSVDTFLGLPFNIASYGLLLEIIAKAVNMVPDQLIGNLGDVHLYSNHIEQAKEQIGRELTHDEKVEYARSLYGTEEWWDINDKRVITVLQRKKQTREPFELPTLKHLRSCDKYKLLGELPSLWNQLKVSDFELENYQSHPAIKAPLSN